MITLELTGPEQAQDVAQRLLKEFPDQRVWLFKGEMGAGKTTLIKGFCNALGVVDPTSSPTFSIVNEYHTAQGQKVYHFDFYRLKSEAEAMDIGVEEYFYSGDYCFIEWPEKIPGLIPEDGCLITLHVNLDSRTISAKK